MKKLICLALILVLFIGIFSASAEEKVDTRFNWYEVFVYSFSDSDGDGIGDLRGLIGKLGYIHDMGFHGIWLMPVMPSPSYHKYDVRDYLAVDEQYGTLDDMKALTAACHELGIRLIIDLPVNHTSTRHPWFLAAVEALKAGRTDDPAINYYNFSRDAGQNHVQVIGTDWYYEEQFAGGHMPDLNLDSEAVRDEIRRIMAFWLLDCGIDGFRLDAVTSFYTGNDAKNIEFLRFLNTEAEALKPGSFLVGECWKGLGQIAEYYQSGIDSFFLFPASQAEGYIAASMRARRPAETYVKNLKRVSDALGDSLLTPFLSNHDTGRTVGLVQGRQSPDRVKFAHALIALMGGYTFTYYGEEIGMAGAGADPNKRLGMLWDEDEVTDPPPAATSLEYPYPGVKAQLEDPLSILNYLKKLNHQKTAMPAIALGTLAFGPTDTDTCIMIRQYQGETLYIAVNFSAKETRDVRLEGRMDLLDQLDTGSTPSSAFTQGPDTLVTLQPYGIAYLKESE